MAVFDLSQPTFSLQAAYVAVNNGDGTFGTSIIVPSVKTIKTTQKTISDRAQGDSRITALASQAISKDLQMDVAGITFKVLQVLTGQTPSSSGSGSTLEDYLQMPNARMQYFGLIAQAWAAENTGDTLLFYPKCKVTTDFTWSLEFGKIVVPSFKFEAILDDNFGYMEEIIERKTIGSIVFPPT